MEKFRGSWIIGLVAAVAAFAALTVVPATAGSKATKIVVTKSNDAELPGDTFKTKGTLKTAPKCLAERKMKLVFVEFDDDKRTVDRTRSRRNGNWKMEAVVGNQDQTAFVKVNGGRGCGGDKTSAFVETR